MFNKLRRRVRPRALFEAGSVPFQYHPLNDAKREYRLINIVNADQAESVEIELHTVSLDDPPPFAMISYTWGFAHDRTTIMCDGRPYLVPLKVADILHSLYHSPIDGVAYAWIDWLCMNQDDVEEKMSQVQLTPLLTRLAQVTIGWTEISISQSTLDFILQMAADVHIRRPGCLLWDGLTLFQSSSKINARNLTANPHFDFAEINGLLDAPLFQRGWVLPDLVLSKHIILRCLHHDLEWHKLCDATEAFAMYGSHPHLNSLGAENILTANLLRQKYAASELKFAETILATKQSQHFVTDRRDPVYSVLGICEDGLLEDYTQSVEETYERAAHMMDRWYGMPLCLSLAGLSTDSTTLPSWVPDLGTTKQRLVLGHPRSMFRASAEPYTQENLDSQTASLTVRGSIVDRIESLQAYMPPRRLCDQYRLDGDNLYCYVQWYKSTSRVDGWADGQASDALMLKFTETIQARGCNSIWEPRPFPSPDETVRRAREFLDFLQNPDVPATNDLRIFNAACLPSHDRRFGITNSGRFCLLPLEAQAGDQICIIDGLKVPLIIRPQEARAMYQNVGESYVHGIMQGELSGESSQQLVII